MTGDDRQKLRDAALAALDGVRARSQTRAASLAAVWELQTSNSFRRIGAHGDGDVLCGTTHPVDGHPDLLGAPGVLDYVVAVQPRVVLELLDYVDLIEQRLSRLDVIEQHMIVLRDVVEKMLREVSR